MIQPPGRTALDPQRIGEQAGRYAKRQNQHCIKDCQQDSRLKICDSMSDSCPSLPGTLQHGVFLEERVDERRNSRTLRQNNQSGDQKEAHYHRHEPPSLFTPEKRQ
jgi:hypothetical protein